MPGPGVSLGIETMVNMHSLQGETGMLTHKTIQQTEQQVGIHPTTITEQ